MSKTILIIDDSSVMRITLNEVLAKEGYRVLEADDGSTGLTVVQTETPDLVICDVNMPMDGLTFLAEMRKIPRLAYTPVIMLTTESKQSMIDEGKRHGARAWIVKPFNEDKLKFAVATLLGA